jgi:hypothetical protein
MEFSTMAIRNGWRKTIKTVVIGAAFSALSTHSAAAFERFCSKNPNGSFKGTSIACYSTKGCAFVTGIGADPIFDYDRASVVAALGREKIDGIVTSSNTIIRQIKKFGYQCN